MALQKSVVPVPFSKGLDLKTDPKQIIMGKFLVLENGIFTSPGRIQKRNGFAALSQIIEGGSTTIPTGTALANFKKELLLLTGTEAYSFSESTTRWSDKQTITNLELSVSSVVRNTYQQNTPDIAVHSSGLQVVTYQDSRGGSRYCLIDSITGEQLVSDKLISATAIKPKPFVMGNFLSIVYIDTATNHLRILPIPVLTPLAPFPVQDLALNVSNTNPNYDATTYTTRLWFAYNSNAGSIIVNSMNFFLVLSASYTQAGEVASEAITISADSVNGQLWVAYANGTQVKYFIYNGLLLLAPTLIEANSNPILNISLLAANGISPVFYTQTATLPSNNFIRTAQLTNLGVVTGNRVF